VTNTFFAAIGAFFVGYVVAILGMIGVWDALMSADAEYAFFIAVACFMGLVISVAAVSGLVLLVRDLRS
jgi:hypothetical protein